MFIQLIRRSSILITGQFFYFNTFSLTEFISPHPDSDLSFHGIVIVWRVKSKGLIKILDDFDKPLDDFQEYM